MQHHHFDLNRPAAIVVLLVYSAEIGYRNLMYKEKILCELATTNKSYLKCCHRRSKKMEGIMKFVEIAKVCGGWSGLQWRKELQAVRVRVLPVQELVRVKVFNIIR